MRTKRKTVHQQWNAGELYQRLQDAEARLKLNRQRLLDNTSDIAAVLEITSLINEDSVKVYQLKRMIENMANGKDPLGERTSTVHIGNLK